MTYQLQILHASDLEGGVDAIENAPNFAAIIDVLEDLVPNSITLSAGDNYLAGPFFNASSDFSLRDDLQAAYQELFGEAGLTNIREGVGRTDISIMNIIGFDAAAIGNHEFDLGSDTFESIIEEDVRGGTFGDVRWLGAQFPYLSANLDFSADPFLGNLYQSLADGILANTEFDLTANEAISGVNPKKIAPATIIHEGGEMIGVVGATTQVLESISSPGGTVGTAGQVNDMHALAAVLQPVVNELTSLGINKIVLVSHLQQFSLEQQLSGLLSGVDVIVAGGSDTIVADGTDHLRQGDTADVNGYPFVSTDADGNPVAIVSTDGEYSYVGRLVVDFDANGIIDPNSIDANESGAFATDHQGLTNVYGAGNEGDAFLAGTKGAEVKALVEAVSDVVISKDGNILGNTSVYIEGRREFVRTEETTLGNLSADANLAAAKAVDPTVMVSIKNGGGIRSAIGEIDGLTGDLLPTSANPAAGKQAGDISQLDVENALRFNNGLTLLDLTADGLLQVLEHAVAASGGGNTPGQFGQFSGISFAFDPSQPAGDRVTSASLTDDQGNLIDVLAVNGELVGDPSRVIRIVTLNFMAGGGDSYPFPALGTNRVDITSGSRTGMFTFADDNSEQDALAEYLGANFGDDFFRAEETPASEDTRVQNLDARADEVIAPEGDEDFVLTPLSTFATGAFDESAAEIVTYDPASQKVFVVNANANRLDILDLSDPNNINKIGDKQVDVDVPQAGGINSVATKNGLVAVAVENANEDLDGFVAFYDTDGNFLGSVQAGNLPDMVTFTPDGSKVLVANEGEPTDNGDPMGSISIIDLSNGVANATVTDLDFTQFDGMNAELANRGVRIFPNTNPSEDFEPEYITVSPDGSTAFVSLQEANAIAVVDVNSGTIVDVQGLGVKDFSRDLPSLETFDFNSLPALGTDANGLDIDLGGFSGLHFDGINQDNGNYMFLTVPDRGPNGSQVVAGSRTFNLPDYQAQIVSFELNPLTGDLNITNQLMLTDGAGNPITGRPNIDGFDEIPVDAAGNPLAYDPFGADMEGIVRVADGTFWTVDEYRPAIYHFNEQGEMIDRFVPDGTGALGGDPAGTYGSETLPEVYNDHRANRGFEGMAWDNDNDIIYAFIQTPIPNPDRATSNESHVIRMLGVDPATGNPVSEYVYLLDRADLRPGGAVDKIGDAVYLGNGEFAIIERDSTLTDPEGFKGIYQFNLTGATDVLGMDIPALTGGQTLEQLSPDELEAFGIGAIEKIKVANLPSLGYTPSDKPEGLTVLPDGSLAVINDNDFGIEDSAGLKPQLGIISFDQPNGLDPSDKDDLISIQHHPVYGYHMPDAIASYEANGQLFYLTANEGDGRDFDESRIKDLTLDPVAFPNAAELQQDEVLGRLKVSNLHGDLDGDGDFDQLFSYSSRSFSIRDEFGNVVFDSGNDLARIVADFDPRLFNSQGDNDSFDNRSDDKGVEAEAITVGEVDGRMIAFIGLERAGGIAAYDITDPYNAQYLTYVNNADLSVAAGPNAGGDIGPEGLFFIDDKDSPNGMDLLLVGNEVSGTTTVYSVQQLINQAPVVADDHANVTEDTPAIIDVLTNDSDADGTMDVVTVSGNPANGTAVVNQDGTVTYTPNTGFLGADSFTYNVTDNDGAVSANATVNVMVAAGPCDDFDVIDLTGANSAQSIVMGAGFEAVDGSNFADRVLGNSLDNGMLGRDGNDVLSGNGGNDLLIGGQDHDLLYGNEGHDILSGGQGFDLLRGGEGNDQLDGGASNDRFFTGNGDDLVLLADGHGADRIFDFDVNHDAISLADVSGLNSFADVQGAIVQSSNGAYLTYAGGTVQLIGVNVADLSASNFVFSHASAPIAYGTDCDDLMNNGEASGSLSGLGGDDALFGLQGNDGLFGGNGGDYLDGGRGNDLLRGGAGDDDLIGGAGNDRIFTGAGEDVVLVQEHDGADRLFDFTPGEDRVDVSALGFNNFADVSAALADASSGVVLSFNGGTLQFRGLAEVDLSAGDFIL